MPGTFLLPSNRPSSCIEPPPLRSWIGILLDLLQTLSELAVVAKSENQNRPMLRGKTTEQLRLSDSASGERMESKPGRRERRIRLGGLNHRHPAAHTARRKKKEEGTKLVTEMTILRDHIFIPITLDWAINHHQ
jgi:hypothetical protein